MAAAVLLVWGRSLSHGFVWDDEYYIVRNQALREPTKALCFFTDKTLQKSEPPYPYRPLRTLHYAVLTWLGGGHPYPLLFHAANLFWHALAVFFCYFVFLNLSAAAGGRGERARASPMEKAAFFAALGFAVHPAAAEVVAWAKSLDDLMALAFFSASLLAWFRARYAVGVLLYAAALFSKESTAALFPLFLFPIFLKQARRAFFPAAFGAQCALAVLFLLLRHAVLGHTAQVSGPLSGSFLQTAVDMLPAATFYFRFLFGIPPFYPDPSFYGGDFQPASLAVWAGALVLAGVAGGWVWASRRDKAPFPIVFCAAWAGLSFLPYLNVIPMMQYFAVRFTYPAIPAFVFGLAYALRHFLFGKRVRYGWLAGVIALWAVTAFAEAGRWKDNRTLMESVYYQSPHSARIVVNYLLTLDEAGETEKLKRLVAQHAPLIQNEPETQWLRARAYLRSGEVEEAARCLAVLEKEGRLGDNPDFWIDIGIAQAMRKDFQKARGTLESVTRRWPFRSEGWENLGQCLNDLGLYEEAMVSLETAFKLDPFSVNAWKGYSFAAWRCGNWKRAERAFGRLAALDPGNPEHAHWRAESAKRSKGLGSSGPA